MKSPARKAESAEQQLTGFLGKFTPQVARQARAALRALKSRLPGAMRLVYDNYNALAIGFGPSERASEAILSIAVYPRWVSLFFLQGAKLRDPQGVLAGSGSRVRHVVLTPATRLDSPAIEALVAQALARARVPLDPKQRGRLVVRSVSAKQRPRRPTS